MSVTVSCERCGYTHTADHDDLLRLDWRRPCPVCDPADTDERVGSAFDLPALKRIEPDLRQLLHEQDDQVRWRAAAMAHQEGSRP